MEFSQDARDGIPAVHVYSPLDGEIRETCTLPFPDADRPSFSRGQSPFQPIASDINGDGRDEVIINLHDRLLGVGFRDSRPSRLWETAPENAGQISPPIVADAYSDQRTCIMYTTSGGYLKILR